MFYNIFYYGDQNIIKIIIIDIIFLLIYMYFVRVVIVFSFISETKKHYKKVIYQNLVIHYTSYHANSYNMT